jgi:Zinc carboxypeptidase
MKLRGQFPPKVGSDVTPRLPFGIAAGFGLLLIVVAGVAAGQTPVRAVPTPTLPPVPEWSGRSRALIRPPSDRWVTPSESTGFRRTPSYDDTVVWLRRLAAATRQIRLVSLGRSAEGRELWMVVASVNGAATPAELRANGRPTLLAQAGIHAGEIDGKDAGLMLLRDLTVGRRLDLLQVANLLFVPIFNADGHERIERYGRINQRGPDNAGWRTTATNLNLNRDYTKLDAPETRAIVAALNAWDPELYLDLHVTDGGDYQYDVALGGVGRHGRSPAIADWLDRVLIPKISADLRAEGHVPGPLWIQGLADVRNPARGYVEWPAEVRFSTGYGDARRIPTLLIENHSLKPYQRRVLSNRVLLESALRTLGAQAVAVRTAREQDRARRDKTVVLAWRPRAETVEESVLGMSWEIRTSAVTGGRYLAWTGSPTQTRVPVRYADVVASSVTRPRAYWIPAAWQEVIARVNLHGIRTERIPESREVSVEVCKLENVELERMAYEGRVRLNAKCKMEQRRMRMPAGSVRVSTDQSLGALAAVLLEAESLDSYLQWGFFHAVLQATEYVEAYVMEPMAERMLADASVRAAYDEAVARDPTLAASPDARLLWLYRRSPWADAHHLIYPVFRELP